MKDDKERLLEVTDLAHENAKLRLFVEAPLFQNAAVTLKDAQAHYVIRVMRAKAGERVLLFNGRDGEWLARLVKISRKEAILSCDSKTAEQAGVPDLWLAFAPIKKTPADYVAQKATELGASRLQPVFTQRTVVRRVNTARLRANAIEAAEQSGRLSVPDIAEPVALDALIRSWPKERRLVFCDEGGDARPIAEALAAAKGSAGAWGVLTGPEGGFGESERRLIRGRSFVIPVTLGPRIMRADTAALAALAVWQSVLGDWAAL
jgi:16S rRNA (uracil1498-N3)-methyltransferase